MRDNVENMSVNAIRVLAADAVQKANSGHPGLDTILIIVCAINDTAL